MVLDVLFCHVDDFCQEFEAKWPEKLLNHGEQQRHRAKNLFLSETMTILIGFHQNHFQNCQHFYLYQVLGVVK
ncbi:hypothetical protein NIES593_05855 [Hydrococcus rivularis NIES-593]|uniref:IS982 family transposase n=1 Tax=Hydrococcus rivularis NIES-593 TaxID=1921803 RepID=A0A1U7HP33_9CYAN|nr:hypothetical protein NIES593_05855 [Hydrococcus rivularis NIES-593]